jgi:NAD(P)H dehydrogenase (quinone)
VATTVAPLERNTLIMTILVTGASGHLGRLIVDALLRDGADPASIIAGARSVDSLAELGKGGVTVARVDYTDPASLDAALAGVETVVLVSSSEIGQRFAQHSAVIDAAKAAGVSRIIYTSAPAATTSQLILAPEHKATEEYLHASGLTYTILRNNWYNENYLSTLQQAAATGAVVTSTGDGRVASASRADFADAAAAVAVASGHENATYELSGDVAWTGAELAAAVGEALGREIAYQPLTTDEHLAMLTAAGLDEGTAGFLVALDANIARGDLAQQSGELTRLIGRPTTPLVETLRAAL